VFFLGGLERFAQQALQGEAVIAAQFQFRTIE
jgi:hypothetical protein